ncbi:hypothetical protein RRG08_047282 [Elysia crispata]|uniref:Uncharacterized protein n=1 Tax=Elysia crispata TaxID=231223 RepID=A0AAE0ZC61_9GAST|nr:hypothetical protein RRG08_047282 [Elysia crispata]
MPQLVVDRWYLEGGLVTWPPSEREEKDNGLRERDNHRPKCQGDIDPIEESILCDVTKHNLHFQVPGYSGSVFHGLPSNPPSGAWLYLTSAGAVKLAWTGRLLAHRKSPREGNRKLFVVA